MQEKRRIIITVATMFFKILIFKMFAVIEQKTFYNIYMQNSQYRTESGILKIHIQNQLLQRNIPTPYYLCKKI